MNYISSREVSSICNTIKRNIALGFKIKDNYCKATTDLISYKDIILAVNAYFLQRDDQGNASCQLEFVIPVNRAIPTFELHTSSPNLIIFIVGICVMVLCYFLAKVIGLYIGFLYLVGIGCLIYGFFNSIFTFFRKLKMSFSNSEFNKKYSVSGDNVDQIKRFFNDKICMKLVNYELNHNVKTINYFLLLDTFYHSFKEDELNTKLTEFVEEAVNVAIIFNDTGKGDSVSNSNNPELTSKKLIAYFRNRCIEEKANQF